MEDDTQLYFHRKVFTSNGTILHIAAIVLKLQAGYDLNMLADKATIDKAQAGGAVSAIQIRLRKSGRGSLGWANSKISIQVVAVSKLAIEKSFCSTAILTGPEPVPGKEKPECAEIAIPHRNPSTDIIPPLPIKGIPHLTRARKLIIPLIKAIQPAVIRIIFLTFTT